MTKFTCAKCLETHIIQWKDTLNWYQIKFDKEAYVYCAKCYDEINKFANNNH